MSPRRCPMARITCSERWCCCRAIDSGDHPTGPKALIMFLTGTFADAGALHRSLRWPRSIPDGPARVARHDPVAEVDRRGANQLREGSIRGLCHAVRSSSRATCWWQCVEAVPVPVHAAVDACTGAALCDRECSAVSSLSRKHSAAQPRRPDGTWPSAWAHRLAHAIADHRGLAEAAPRNATCRITA